MDGLDAHRADGDRLAIADGRMREGGLGGRMNVNAGSRLGRQGLVTREVVGVDMRLDDMGEKEAFAPGPGGVVVHAIPARVHDQRFTRLAAPYEVGDTAGVLVDELLEYHRLHLPTRPPWFARPPGTRASRTAPWRTRMSRNLTADWLID